MYKRIYSLKTRYNFHKTLKYGQTYTTDNLIIKYIKVDSKVFNSDNVDKKFGIIVSSKFHKKAVVKNKVKRLIGEAIRINIDKFPPYHYYIFIPKKNVIQDNSKIKLYYQDVDSQIDKFLSEMAIS